MSLYNALFGQNPLSGILLYMAGIRFAEIPRFRDCYMDGDDIVVYTRTGGGNDECYCEDDEGKHGDGCYWLMNRELEKKPNFKAMQYDDFDSTYAYFRFSPLAEHSDTFAELTKIMGGDKPATVSEKFKALMDAIKEKAI